MITNEELFSKIKLICDRKDIKPLHIEKKLGLGNGTIGKYGRGLNPSWKTIGFIAEELDASLDFIYGKSPDPQAVSPQVWKLFEAVKLANPSEKTVDALIAALYVLERDNLAETPPPALEEEPEPSEETAL